MARTPAAPADTDPGAEKVTMTQSELTEMVNAAVAKQFAVMSAAKGKAPEAPKPTMEEAKVMAEARLADGMAPIAIETSADPAWFVHSMVGATPDQVEQYNAKTAAKAKAAAAKAAKDAEDAS